MFNVSFGRRVLGFRVLKDVQDTKSWAACRVLGLQAFGFRVLRAYSL